MKEENSLTAKQLFHSAQSYEEAYYRLKTMADASPTTFALLFQPIITCVTFSLELYLKCLITLEGNKYPCRHEFSLLYNKLDSESRNSICEMLYKINQEKAELIQAIHTHKNTAGVFLTEDALMSYLKDNDKAFTDWRYMEIKKGHGIQPNILHTIIEAVRLVIKAKCPTM